jgi:hypothetical protein
MRVRTATPADLTQLLVRLGIDPDAIVTAIADDEAEISYLGSLSEDAQREKLRAQLVGWLAGWELVEEDENETPPR